MIQRIVLAWLALMLAAPAAHAGWRLVGEGDCPGRQVIGGDGDTPDAAICTPEFAGKTALCFDQVCNPGCQYIDVPTGDCKGGAEMARVYTCEPNSTPQEATGSGGK